MRKLLSALGIGIAVLLLGVQEAGSATPAVTVHMTDFRFKPATLSIHTGDSVVFQNDDDVTHNVTADSFKSGDLAGGKSWTYTFAKAGTYTYVCTYHPGMQGTITVTDASP